MNGERGCDGIPFTVEDVVGVGAEAQLMLEHAVQCPLCTEWVRQWRLQNGRMWHPRRGDPGE